MHNHKFLAFIVSEI